MKLFTPMSWEDFEPDQVVENRFRIIQTLGTGSTAVVYKATDLKSKKVVAIKHYKQTNLKDAKEIEYIENEVQFLKKVKNPNIMHCYDILKYSDYMLAIFEYIDGITLSQFISDQFKDIEPLDKLVDIRKLYTQLQPFEKSPKLTEQYHKAIKEMIKDKVKTIDMKKQALQEGFEIQNVEQADYELEQEQVQLHPIENEQKIAKNTTYYETIETIFRQLLNVLVELDKQQVMHRDLKPDNIMITKSMQIKLIDFGFCKREQKANACKTGYVGTPLYMAPEVQTKNSSNEFSYTTKIDVWSVGVILFEILFGYTPFLSTKYPRFEIMQIQNCLMLPTDLYAPNAVDPKFMRIVKSALIMDSDRRASASDLLMLMGNAAEKKAEKVEKTPNNSQAKNKIEVRCAVVGMKGVGKSSLIEDFLKFYKVDKGKNIEMKAGGQEVQVVLSEGVPKSEKESVNACFLVYNTRSRESHQFLKQEMEKVKGTSKDAVFYCVGNNFGGTGEEVMDFDVVEMERYYAVQKGMRIDYLLVEAVESCVKAKNYQGQK